MSFTLLALATLVVGAVSISDVTAGAIIAGTFTCFNTVLNLWTAYLIRRSERAHERARDVAAASQQALVDLTHERQHHDDT